MKSTEVSTKAPQAFIPEPFALDTSSNNRIVPVDDTDFSFKNGWTSVYSKPTINGGKFVARGHMNEIGFLATANEFRRNCGGVNTFSSELCEKIGGYPKGAVLDYLVGSTCYRVISLVDDNTTNFITNGVDGTSWAYCATVKETMTPNWSLKYSNTLLSVSAGETKYGTYVKKASGTFPNNGYVRINFDSDTSFRTSSGDYKVWIVIAGANGETDVSNLSPADITESDDALNMLLMQSSDLTNSTTPVTKGCQYSIWVAQATEDTWVSGAYSIRLFPCV